MATLQKIRNRAGIAIAIFIGMALAAFILGDLFKSSSMFSRGKQMELAVVDGVTISQPEFQAKVSELEEIYKMNSGKTALDAQTSEQIKEQTWQSVVRNLTMKDIYEELGIAVSASELFDMVQGKNPHAIIQSIFRRLKPLIPVPTRAEAPSGFHPYREPITTKPHRPEPG